MPFMLDNSMQPNNSELLPSTTRQEIQLLTTQVKELEEEISELKKDLHAIDLFQKKPIISTESLATGGFWIVAALAVIGIFY